MTPKESYDFWMEKTIDDAEAQAELAAVMDNADDIGDRFYRTLSFGTAGLRGVLGMGTNRMNRYTVGQATQGLADYIISNISAAAKPPSAAIAYDSRNFSEEFARKTACVFAANGIKAYLFRELMPTPALSFAVRELGCDVGVIITASHNPAEYNGYKAYGPDGCQIGPEIAGAVQKAILSTDIFSGVKGVDFGDALRAGAISYIPDGFADKYLDRVFAESLQPQICEGSGLRIVYTPLNGAGLKPVREILRRMGAQADIVPEQEHPDGNFPTCLYPNPEEREALELGIGLCRKNNADLLIATDPDCDRLGVAVKDGGDYRILTGNEVGILLLDYICKTRVKLGIIPKDPVAVRSVVSSGMADKVAAFYGVEMLVVPTGFKFVGEAILRLEEKNQADRFIFAFEESCGYLSGSYVRDKDAVNAAMLTVEMAAADKRGGLTLAGALDELYDKHGFHLGGVDSIAFEGEAGMQKMDDIMRNIRKNPPGELSGAKVIQALDYSSGSELLTGEKRDIPVTDMVEIHLGGGSSVIVRPSGTEPKIKVYYTVIAKDRRSAESAAAALREACSVLVSE